MLKPDKHPVILTLYEEGKSKRHIARLLDVNVKTVRRVIAGKGRSEATFKKNKITIDEEVLRKEYKHCNGYLERLHEILTEDYDYEIGYSTLTLRVRELGLGQKTTSRCDHKPDIPGDEFQYDTSPFTIKINQKKTKVICSGIYFRYSKIRYIKFYRSDNRFNMKCFFYEALRYWGYCAKTCIIDNTCLAVWYGTGSLAVFHPEMENFAKNFGFTWKAHELNHANRKAGKERNFLTVITNFLAGRDFVSMEDLNKQAFDWATDRFAKRPQSKTNLIPIDTFEKEKAWLNKLPDYLPEPYYPPQMRIVSAYGYIAFEANYYWVPEFFGEQKERIKKVSIIRYAGHIVLYYRSRELVRYNLPSENIRNQQFSPEGIPLKHQPKQRKKPSHEEEKLLREMGSEINCYIDFIRSKECRLRQKHHFIRRLYALSGKMTNMLFSNAVKRAREYRVYDINAISRISAQSIIMTDGLHNNSGPEFNDDFKERDAYKQGRFNKEHDLDNLDLFSDTDFIK